MLDLFSGSGGASRAAAVRGWEVVRVDNAPGTAHDIRADLSNWDPRGLGPFDLVWASPPCTQLSTASKLRDVEAGLRLVRCSLELVSVIKPRWWVLENVHGATRAIGRLIGPPVQQVGSFYLWGVFPPLRLTLPRTKTRLSGRRRAERRATIPWELSESLIRACEALASELERGELGASSGGAGGPSGAWSAPARSYLGDISGHTCTDRDLALPVVGVGRSIEPRPVDPTSNGKPVCSLCGRTNHIVPGCCPNAAT